MASSGIDENIERLVEGLSWVVQQSTSPFLLTRTNRLRQLRSRASSAVPKLLTVLSDQNPVAGQTAIQALGEIQAQPEVVEPALTNLLNDPDLGTRMAAGFALRAFGYDIWPQPPRMIHPSPTGQTNER